MTNKEILKKQIIYRSMHRGTKEMDLLLGSFVEEKLSTLAYKDLIDLKTLLDVEDEILQRWYFENKNEKEVPTNKVTQMLKKFKI